MVRVDKIVASRVGAKRLAPVMVESKQPALVYDWSVSGESIGTTFMTHTFMSRKAAANLKQQADDTD